ncbi:MAG: DUF4468 domain-containing protein [Bacteroidales bacterium]|nr:DUF4468 domain-containing protein [Bacteroidales bacterium]
MKRIKLIASLFILMSTSILAQDNISYETVIKTDSVGKSMIYTTIYDWFASNFNSANEVIQMADKDAGVIIGNGSKIYDYGKTSYTCYDGLLDFTLKVYIKNNRYKVVFTNIKHTINAGNSSSCELGMITSAEVYTNKGISKSYHNKVWNDIKIKSKQLSSEIFSSMENKTMTMTELQGEEW